MGVSSGVIVVRGVSDVFDKGQRACEAKAVGGAFRIVSRTRRSVLHAAPQSRDLVCLCLDGPGSAAHRGACTWAARSADSSALRSIRGTNRALRALKAP